MMMNSFDVLIIGGSAAGLSCALILGSAYKKPFANDKNVGVFTHQKASALQNAELNNVLGFKKGTKGADILAEGLNQLNELYPHVSQIPNELVKEIKQEKEHINVITNKGTYSAKNIVVAVTPSNLFHIEGLMQFVQPHTSMPPEKEKIMLKNNNHLVTKGIYVAGVIAGWRSQFAIAAGSGAAVATDILTKWNNDNHAMVHDVVE